MLKSMNKKMIKISKNNIFKKVSRELTRYAKNNIRFD